MQQTRDREAKAAKIAAFEASASPQTAWKLVFEYRGRVSTSRRLPQAHGTRRQDGRWREETPKVSNATVIVITLVELTFLGGYGGDSVRSISLCE